MLLKWHKSDQVKWYNLNKARIINTFAQKKIWKQMWNVRWKIRILVCISALWVHYLNSALVLDMNKLLVKSQIRKYLNLFLKLCTFYASVTLINFAKVVEKYQNSTLCLSVCALGTAQKLCSLDTSSILRVGLYSILIMIDIYGQ